MLALALVAFYGVTSITSFKVSFTKTGDVEIGYDFRNFREVQIYGLTQASLASELSQDNDNKHPSLINSSNVLVPLPSLTHRMPHFVGKDDDDHLVFDRSLFAKRAVQFLIQKEYLRLYEEFGLNLSTVEISAAQNTYNKFKIDQQESKGKSGIVVNLELDKVKTIIDLWLKADLITNAQVEMFKLSLDSSQGPQNAKDVAHRRANGDIIFGRVGIISLQVKKTDPPFSILVYMFRKFNFNLADTDVNVEVKKKCYVWSLFCDTAVQIRSTRQNLPEDESTNLGTYMKWKVAKDYDETNAPYIRYLAKEADRYYTFLPAVFKADWDKINSEPDKDPTEIINRNALDPKTYEF